MFIPNYQIHNILKDFTQHLKKLRTGSPAEADRTATAPAMGPNQLRLATVVTKVADDIMLRIADLGREAENTLPAGPERPPRAKDGGIRTNPAAFDYHLMDGEKGKVKKRLVVEDSRHLVERFQHMTTTGADNSDDSA